MARTSLAHLFSRHGIALMLTGLLLQAFAAFAQTSLQLPFAITVQPATAGTGVPRTITVEVSLPTGCAPTSASVVPATAFQNRAITVLLSGPASAQPCTLLPVTHRYQVSYTPETEEELRILVANDGGMYMGEGILTTRNPASQRSRFDLTGMWYDPATNGSGLTFVHAPKRNDSVFGTWYVYDSTGAPRWYSIQGVQWRADGMVAEGALLEASSPINTCALTLIACPTALSVVRSLGNARIELLNATTARVSALDANGNVLFVSNVIKAAF